MAGKNIKCNVLNASRLSVAPMMDWTDRHCRVFHRMLSRRALLYTEMVTAQAVIHGDRAHLIGFSDAEHPIALQLGGSEPDVLAEAARIGADFGYDEINLNCGCPSDRVQSGAFGACLMREPETVARCVSAMIEACQSVGGPEITVKCRIGVDDQNPNTDLRAFINRIAEAGVRSIAIHARKAWLDGLSPKENRTVPPLNYALALAIKHENPKLRIAVNGGIESLEEAEAHLASGFDGAMIGRAAYHDPARILGPADRRIFGEKQPDPDRHAIVQAMADYAGHQAGRGVPVKAISRHMLGLFSGMPGAKGWRRHISENAHLPDAGPQMLLDALSHIREPLHA